MKISVDLSVCSGHALCFAVAPEVYEIDDDTCHCVLTSQDVPAERERAAREGADACPERAITLLP